MSSSCVLGAYGISYSWTQKSNQLVLNEVSVDLFKGNVVALCGPNGSGKSTLLKIMAGLLPIRPLGGTGQVHYLGKNLFSIPVQRRARAIAYVGSEIKVEFPLTVEETVFLGRLCQGIGFFFRPTQEDQKVVQWAMEKCLCWDLRSRRLDTLSGGERQLVALAKALAQGARIVFLDEAFSRMDLHHQILMGRMIRELACDGWAFLLVSHDMNLALEWADTAIFLKKGVKIFEGPLHQVVTAANMQKIYPEADLVIGKHPVTGSPRVFFGSPSKKTE